MDFEDKMRREVIDHVSKRLKLPTDQNLDNKKLCDLIFLATGWESPYYGKRANFIEMYWRRYCFTPVS